MRKKNFKNLIMDMKYFLNMMHHDALWQKRLRFCKKTPHSPMVYTCTPIEDRTAKRISDDTHFHCRPKLVPLPTPYRNHETRRERTERNRLRSTPILFRIENVLTANLPT